MYHVEKHLNKPIINSVAQLRVFDFNISELVVGNYDPFVCLGTLHDETVKFK